MTYLLDINTCSEVLKQRTAALWQRFAATPLTHHATLGTHNVREFG
jgi:predicted nucleic acid-binding protein